MREVDTEDDLYKIINDTISTEWYKILKNIDHILVIFDVFLFVMTTGDM